MVKLRIYVGGMNMIKEIQGKVLLSRNKYPSSWFGCRYLFNIYRGCEHRCIYCDSRSLCYRIENFDNDYVEQELSKLFSSVIRWAIVDIQENDLVISVSFEM